MAHPKFSFVKVNELTTVNENILNLSVRFDRFLPKRQNIEQDSTLPTLDRDYIPTVGIRIDSPFLQTVERVKIDKMAT